MHIFINFETRVALWALVIGGSVIDEVLFFRIVRQVNERLPEQERWNVGRWFWYLWDDDSLRVERQHRRFFPCSRMRLAMWIAAALWVPLLFALSLNWI